MREWVRAEESTKAAIWGEAGETVEGNTDRRGYSHEYESGKRKRAFKDSY